MKSPAEITNAVTALRAALDEGNAGELRDMLSMASVEIARVQRSLAEPSAFEQLAVKAAELVSVRAELEVERAKNATVPPK